MVALPLALRGGMELGPGVHEQGRADVIVITGIVMLAPLSGMHMTMPGMKGAVFGLGRQGAGSVLHGLEGGGDSQ